MSVTLPTFDWDFRQTVSAGGTVTDSISGNVATLTSSNASCSVSDGLTVVSDNSTAAGWADYEPFTPSSDGFSLEIYFKIGDVSWWPVLFVAGTHITGGAGTFISAVFQHGGASGFSNRHSINASSMPSTTGMYENTDYHLVITLDAVNTVFTVYIDGSQVYTTTSGGGWTSGFPDVSSLSTTTYNRIGARGDGLRGINGNVYYTRFWNGTPITSSEVSTLYANRTAINYFSTPYESGIVPSFDYDFRTGNKDLINGTAEAKYYQYSSGTSTEITKENTINGVSIVGDTPTAAVSGSSSGRDNAGGQYIDLTGDLDTSYQEITIEVYVNIDSTTGKQVDNGGIFHFGVGDRDEMFNLYTNYGTQDTMGFGVQYNIATTTNISAHATGTTTTQSLVDGNNYIHFVFTCNGPTVNFYINGSLFSTATNNSYSFGSATRSFNFLGRSSRFDEIGGFIFATFKYCRVYNTALSSTQAATLYNNRDSIKHFQLISDWTTLRTNYGDVYLAQTLNKTLADYKAENIPIQDISFGAFHANKYKQSYVRDLLDVSGSFIQRQHIFYSDMSFNVSDLSADQVIVNNDLSINSGFNIFQDSSFNSHVGIVGDASINGTLTIEDNSIPESALNFAKPASNFGTFDSTQDVSMSNTFTLQGDHERFIDLSQNIQTDFSENIVLVPGSLGIDLSGGIATLSGKTGDQAFLNGTYIVKDNSGNTTGNIYDDINENTTSTPAVLSATPDYYWDFRVATPSGNTLADRVSGINATYYGGITSSETTGVSFTERSGWSSFSGNTQTEYIKPGNIVPGTNFTVEYYLAPNYTFNGFGQIFRIVSTSNGTLLALMSVYYAAGMNINIGFYPDDGVSYNVMAHSGTGNVYAIPYNTPSQVVVSYDDSNKVFKIYINGSLWSITYDDSSRATGATAENTSWGYASGTAVSNAEGSITCDNNLLGASGLTSGSGRPFEGNFYYVRHYKDKILTDADVAILYANASTINWDFQTVVNNNKLTSLPKNWNTFQLQSGGGWLYDGSSNYTSYLDQYGRPQTVKGDNYDLTLPFHFYPSKAFLRTTPVLPTGTTNPDNYPASVKFLGASTQVSNYEIDTTPTFNWDFRTNVDASGVVIDSISQNKATINDTFCTEGDGLICNNLGHKATFEPFLTSDVANTVEMFCYHERNDSSLSAYWFNIVDTEDSKSTGYIAHRIRNNGNNDFYVNGSSVGSTYTYPNSPNFDAVNHIVMTTTSTTAKCYVNGSLVGSTTHSRTLVAGTYGYNSIGNRGSDTSQLYGNIYYVRFWNGTEITANQVSALYNNRYNTYLYKNTGPSKYYLLGEFDNKATTVFADSSANYTHNSLVYDSSDNYLHGADFLYNLNRKYYVNQLRMIVDKAPHRLPTSNAPTHFWNFRVDQTINSGDTIQDSISGVNGTFNTTKTLTSSQGYSNTSDNTSAVSIDSMEIQGTFSFEFYGQLTSINTVGACPFFNLRKSDGAGGYNDTARRAEFKTASNGKILFYTDLTTNGVIYSSNAFTDFNTDVHLIIVFNNDDLTAKVYQNGSLLMEDTMTGPRVTDTFDNFELFNTYAYSRGLFCHAYQVRMWNGTALTATEVSSIYKTLTGSENYGEYSIDRLAYSGSSFSGKKMESNNPNLYLNTAYDISYGFTEDHTTSVYDMSYNKNQFSILDVSGGGVVQVNPIIKLEDSSLNTININKPNIQNTYSKTTETSVRQPGYEWDFLTTGAANSTLSDNISGATATYGSNVTSDTTDGVLYNGDGGPGVDDITLPNNIEFSSSFSIEFIFRVNNNSDPYRAIWKFGSGTTNNIFCDTFSTTQKLRIWMLSNSSTITFNSSLTGTHTGATMNFDGSTFHHVVFTVDSSIGEAAYYQDGVKVWYQTGINLSESNFPLISSAYSGIGDVNEGGNMNFKKFRIWNNTALTESEVQFLNNNQSTNYYNFFTLFNSDFYTHFGIRDSTTLFNNRISNDGKTIATLNHRGTQGYDLSNAEVVFSTDYGKNWKNVLQDCSDTFLFNENDISYGFLFTTGDASGTIDIATSGNGQTMYVGRQRNVFSTEGNYTDGLGYVAPQTVSLPSVAATNNHTDQSVADLRYFPQCFIGNNTGSSDITVSNLTGTDAAFNGTFKVSLSSGLGATNSNKGLWALMGTDTWTGQYAVNNYVMQVSNFNNNRPTVSYVGGSVTLHYLLLEFPAYVKFDTWYFWVDDRFRTGSFIGTDANGDNQLLGSWSDSWNNGQQIYARSFNGANNTYVNKLYIMLNNQSTAWGYIQPMWFTGTYQTPSTPGIPIPTSGLPEIYTTNYGNSWKLSPFKYHSGPTIISGDGSTILLLQQQKLNNDRHGYVSSLGNETSSIDCHWLTTDYGATWRTLNRSGHDASNNIIPPSYGSKTATFFKACMSYSGQYIYIYNVQCTTNSNYGELYYSHDYGVTFNKWVTSEAQTVITGTGQISCSGSGKYVYIAGTNSSSAFVYYRSTDYGLTFNKDITKFPWQSYTLSESSTSAGPFISYEGDLIVTAGNNTTVTTGNSDLQYSLDYGVNYNDLSLNSDTISNITNSFTNLPNKTNTLFTTTDVSTKTGIFANSPGPNEYKFLTNVLGQTDVSNIYLQTIEFPKENPTKTIENEGPVFFTSEEPIDKENDFGQNISNSSAGSNKLWNIAVSEDGQKLLAGGAVDISNGEYYSGYNLTNAKFPPTENQVSLSNIIAKPILDFDFRVASTTGITDSISGVAISYLGTDTSTVSGGYYKSGYNNTNRPYTTSSTFSGIGTNFSLEFYFMHGNTSSAHNTRTAFSMKNTTTGEYISIGQDGEFKNRFVTYINGTIGARWHNCTSGRDTKIHFTFVYDYDNQVAKFYENGSYVDTLTTQYVATTHSQHLDDGNLKAFSSGTSTVFDSFLWCGSTSGRIVGDANYYYTRVYNKALTQTEIDYLYANRDTVSASLASNWTVSPYNNLPQFRTANLSYNGNHALLVPYGVTQIHQQKLIYWTASGDFHRFEENHMSNFDAENWKFGKLSGDGNFFVGFTHSSTALSDTNYNSDTWWTDPVSNTMIIYKTMQKISKGTVADATATTEAGGTTYDLNNAFSSDSGVTSYHITHVNVSETGQYILIVGGNSSSTYTNRCAFSSDFGVTFTDISSKFSFTDVTKALVYCHVSDNGRYLFISQYNSNEYCFSSDYGNTFTLRNTFPSSTKTYGVVSRDGQNALFVDTNKYVYTSVNGNFRQEAIPALSGVNSGLSLTHNNWKYTSTLSDVLTYNPSMPNIKYFLGTISTEVTTPTFYWDFRQTVSAGGTVTDSISGNIATLSSSNATCTTSGGLTIPSNNTATGTGYADFQAFTTNSNGFSVEMYYYAGTTSWNVTPFHIGNNVSNSDNLIFGVFSGTSGTYEHQHIINDHYSNASGTTMNDNQIYHIVVTFDAINSVYTIYNDGVQVFQATDGTGFPSGTFPSILSKTFSYNRIGARGDSKRGLNGNCYYFRFWNGTAITSSEVSTLYANRTTTNYNFNTHKITSSTVRYTGSYFSELDVKGSLTNLSGTGYTSSDYRVKKNVTSLDEADTIASLVPVSYTQNNLHHKKAIGFIAHEFAQSFPDLVIGEKDGPEMQSINYNGVIAILIKEVQTLRAKINELKSQI